MNGLFSLTLATAAGDLNTWWYLTPWLLALLGTTGLSAGLLSMRRNGQLGGPAPFRRQRRYYAIATVFFLSIAIYGSLVPLNFRWLDWNTAFERFTQTPYLKLGVGQRADWVANILLFVPLGFCGSAAFGLPSRFFTRNVVACVLVVVVFGCTSLGIEFTQLWFPPRTVSQNDVLAETLGAAIGLLLWLAAGEPLTAWLQQSIASQQQMGRLGWVLRVYCFAFLIYSVMPLDLTISLSELAQKYREGRVRLVPFAEAELSAAWLFQIVKDCVVFLPIGMLTATWGRSSDAPVRALPWAAMGAVVIAGAIEVLQLLVFSRHSSVSDVICGTLGGVIGAWLIARWHGGAAREPLPKGQRRAWLWLGAATVYGLCLLLISCPPFDGYITDPEVLRARYAAFYQVPFARLYWGPEFNALNQLLSKSLLFAPLGVFFSLSVDALQVPTTIRRVLLSGLFCVAILLALAIEMGQIFVPDRFPDITDVFLRPIGTAVAMLLLTSWLGHRRRQ